MPWKAWVAAIAIVGGVFAIGHAHAAPNVVHLNWGSQLNPSDCTLDAGYRYLEVNVTQQVGNDADVAQAGPYNWASLEYNRHIQIWRVGVGGPPALERFCVLVKYQGSWTTSGTYSPNDAALRLQAGIDGTFEGGYRATIDGLLDETAKLRGRLGPVDRGFPNLPGTNPAVLDDWIRQYFTVFNDPVLEWWGWIYHGGPNSTFVHACAPDLGHPDCSGTSGNITQ